jgi:hypothetical protein
MASSTRSTLLLTCALSLLSASGCKSKGQTAAVETARSASRVSSLPGVDEALLNELRTIGKTCQAAADGQAASGETQYRCTDSGNWKLISDFLRGKRDRAGAVHTLAVALEDTDSGVRALGASLLRSAFGSHWGRDRSPSKVEPRAARALLENVLKQPRAAAKQLVPAAVNAAMLAGESALLHEKLARAEHRELKPAAYPHLMTMGRLTAFDTIKQLTSDQDTDLALAALEAPLNMSHWNETEQVAICEWARGLLDDKRTEIATRAGLVIANCWGGMLDELLDRAERRVGAKDFEPTALGPPIKVCAPERDARPKRPTQAQCERVRKLLFTVADSAAFDEKSRVSAIGAMPLAWPDERSEKLLKRLQKDPNPQVASAARQNVEAIALVRSEQPSSTPSAVTTGPR